MTNQIYHNPRCSKSRAALQLLTEQEVDFSTIEYLKEPPTVDELDTICSMLDVEPLAMMRTNEARFKELGLSKNDERSRREWLTLMADNPILIERPIIVIDGRAVIGRPPENINQILNP